jgi:hypothetical protein
LNVSDIAGEVGKAFGLHPPGVLTRVRKSFGMLQIGDSHFGKWAKAVERGGYEDRLFRFLFEVFGDLGARRAWKGGTADSRSMIARFY